MIYATIEKMITQSLSDSRWAHAIEECAEKSTKSADKSAGKIAVPISKEPAPSKTPGSSEATKVSLEINSVPAQPLCSDHMKKNVPSARQVAQNNREACKTAYPPELLAVVEAEESRSAQKIAHI